MSLDKDFLNRESNISAKILADSVNDSGDRITSFVLEYPRFIHSEVMTHRDFSRNSSSSRAIPQKRMLEMTEANLAMPVYFGKNKSGMQAVEEIEDISLAQDVWTQSYGTVANLVKELGDLGLHKQLPNRLIEPFQMIKVVLTSTNFANFFNLRVHKDAQPEILMLAKKMLDAYKESIPSQLAVGEWHLPYVETKRSENPEETYYYITETDNSGTETDGFEFEKRLSLEEAIKISASSCASVSYRTEGMTLEKAGKIFDMLIKAEVVHSSPFEHIAKPINLAGCEVSNPDTWCEGVTHMRRNGKLCSGNLVGWVQYRHLLKGNTCNDFDWEGRWETF